MSLSFRKVWENVHPDAEHQGLGDSPLLDSGDNGEVLTAIRNGLNLRKSEDCGNFWDDFISICNNSTALAALLGVKAEQISSWPMKVRKALDKVEDEDSEEKKPKLVQTGDVGNDGPEASQDGNYDIGQPGQTRPQ
tara:strand:- start:52 stop:459 length:408 start_codon:yes stop_codon:yes gene_type:complete